MDAERWLRFIHFDHFAAEWKSLKLKDDDLRELEIRIISDPSSSPVVSGTGGLRKMRFAPPSWHMGKRGALRIGYAYYEKFGVVALIAVYAKNNKADLSPAERKQVKLLLQWIEDWLTKGA